LLKQNKESNLSFQEANLPIYHIQMKISEYQYILCSSFARVKDILVEQDILHPAPIQIGVITNAADVDKEENVPLWWIDEDISALEDL
jgi:hypothetical protein